jgi:polysaccharide chain length determinant protein (PEP-CTERM system associated)
MLPGKKYSPEDLLLILRQRVWWVLIPFALVSAGTAAVARKLPDRYYSDSLLRVVPQQVPEEYVKSTITTNITDRLQSMQQQILSRSRLERLIDQFDLYPEERKRGIMEDVVQQMKNDVSVQIQKGDTFRVGFTGSNPRTVQKVADQLAQFFVQENATDRSNLAQFTSQFLDGQLEEAHRRLIDQEQKLRDYEMKYSGQLPTQLGSNLQAQSNAQMQIRQIVDAINRDSDRRLALESTVKELEGAAPGPDAVASGAMIAPGGDSVQGGSLAQQLEVAKAQLAAMQKTKSDLHPDVKQWKSIVATLQAKVDADALTRPVSADPVVSPVELTRQRRLKEARDQLAQVDKEMTQMQTEVKNLRATNDALQVRIDAVPTRESELIEVKRDYDTMTKTYNDLLARREESKVAASLENRQYGETFRIVDPARVPERPNSPNRPMINLAGMGAGLGVGLLLVALLEYRDRSFKTDDEIISLLALPVLAVVPMMQSNDERRRARRHRFYLGIGLGGTVVGCLAVLIYTFVR